MFPLYVCRSSTKRTKTGTAAFPILISPSFMQCVMFHITVLTNIERKKGVLLPACVTVGLTQTSLRFLAFFPNIFHHVGYLSLAISAFSIVHCHVACRFSPQFLSQSTLDNQQTTLVGRKSRHSLPYPFTLLSPCCPFSPLDIRNWSNPLKSSHIFPVSRFQFNLNFPSNVFL